MNTKTRLALMFGLLLLAFGVSAWNLHLWYDRQADRMLADLQIERQHLLEQVLPLTSQPLRNFANDYSNWDEMLAFVRHGDPAWASVNIDASLQTFGLHAAWVLRADGTLVYGTVRQLSSEERNPPFPLSPVLEKLRREKFPGFFVVVPEGLLEVRAAPIQPSSDIKRESEAQGWLLVGQLWNVPYLTTLGKVLDSKVSLVGPEVSQAGPPDESGIHLLRDLAGWDGKPLRQLSLDYRPASLVVPLENDRYELYVFCTSFLAVILFTFGAVSYWVIKPLRQLEQSMTSRSPAALAGLRDQPDEFGRLAHLAAASFVQRTALENEINERKRTEAALRESEEQLRRSTDLRIRLARDLHDNVIQSIYATGLGLESIHRKLLDDPPAAEKHLEAVQATLNRIIREIRSFISGLEPEDAAKPGQFGEVLHTLAATLQSLHPIEISLNLDREAAGRLTVQEETHALQIVREGVSNAMRHGGATRIELRLLDLAGVSVLQIEDNGCGFDPASATGVGSGLSNQNARAREMGATLHFDSAPGDGTRITLKFNRIVPA